MIEIETLAEKATKIALSEPATNEEIALRLGVSKRHIKNISYKKCFSERFYKIYGRNRSVITSIKTQNFFSNILTHLSPQEKAEYMMRCPLEEFAELREKSIKINKQNCLKNNVIKSKQKYKEGKELYLNTLMPLIEIAEKFDYPLKAFEASLVANFLSKAFFEKHGKTRHSLLLIQSGKSMLNVLKDMSPQEKAYHCLGLSANDFENLQNENIKISQRSYLVKRCKLPEALPPTIGLPKLFGRKFGDTYKLPAFFDKKLVEKAKEKHENNDFVKKYKTHPIDFYIKIVKNMYSNSEYAKEMDLRGGEIITYLHERSLI